MSDLRWPDFSLLFVGTNAWSKERGLQPGLVDCFSLFFYSLSWAKMEGCNDEMYST